MPLRASVAAVRLLRDSVRGSSAALSSTRACSKSLSKSGTILLLYSLTASWTKSDGRASFVSWRSTFSLSKAA